MGSGKGYELAPFDPYAKQPKMSYKVSTACITAQWHHRHSLGVDLSSVAVRLKSSALR